jgi:hypothetical protein
MSNTGSSTADADAETDTCLQFDEAKDFDKDFLIQQRPENAINVENLDIGVQPLLSTSDVESFNEKLMLDNETEERVDVVDFYISNLANTLETRLNAAILGRGNIVTLLAGNNFARSSIAFDLQNVRDSFAVLAVCDVIPERRSNDATTT